MEKNGRWKKGEGKNRKNNKMESSFWTTANIFVRNFLKLIGFKLSTNFIRIIRLDNLIMHI